MHSTKNEGNVPLFIWKIAGDYDDEAPPVPMPNTEVKLICAEDTWMEASWENRSLPALSLSFFNNLPPPCPAQKYLAASRPKWPTLLVLAFFFVPARTYPRLYFPIPCTQTPVDGLAIKFLPLQDFQRFFLIYRCCQLRGKKFFANIFFRCFLC